MEVPLHVCVCVCVAFSLFVCVLYSSPHFVFRSLCFHFHCSLLSPSWHFPFFSIWLQFSSRIFYVGFLASHNDDQKLPPSPFILVPLCAALCAVCTSHIAIALHIASGTTNSRRSSSAFYCFCFFLSCSYFCSVIFAIQRFVQRSVAVTFFVHFISVILRCN